MPNFNVDTAEITAFDFGNTHMFTAYIDGKQLFDRWEKCYNMNKYSFKVPEDD